MEINPIKTEKDYQAALLEADALMDAELDTPEGDRLDILVTLIERYESKHCPIDPPPPDPVAAITFFMERKGLTPKDLVPCIGQLNRVYEILNRKRGLSLRMIRNLHQSLGIPLDNLIVQAK
jgi:HTH-type transcriptional regulator/antitoxin HigA